MVRGCEKRIYYVKNPESELFDEAYLILRRGVRTTAASPRELELEAMRILRASDSSHLPKEKKRRGNMKAFIAGAVMSALMTGAIALFLWLIL